MDRNRQRKAQQRVERIAAFRGELAELEREQGLALTPEQRSRLEAHLDGVLSSLKREFGVDISDSTRRISWGIRIATLLGGLAFFAAVILFLHRIWGFLPFALQAGVLMTLPLLLLAFVEVAHRRGAPPYYQALLGLAAGVGFVLGLNALESIVNMAFSAHTLLAWGLFAMLVAYGYGLRLLLGSGLVLLCAYTGALIVALGGDYWESFMAHAACLLPAAVILYAVPELTRHRHLDDFDFVYRLCGAAVGLIALLMLSKSADLCCSAAAANAAEAGYQLAGLGVGAGVVFHGLRLARSGLVNLGAGAFVVFLFVRLHDWWWDWMPKYLFFLLLGLTALGLALAFRRLRHRLVERAGP